MSLQDGRIFLFFFDPQCSTCFAVGKSLAPLKFQSDVKFVGVPTNMPEWGPGWMGTGESGTGLLKPISPDAGKLREVFKFDYPPYGVLIEHGRQAGVITISEFDEVNPEHHIKLLRDMGVIE